MAADKQAVMRRGREHRGVSVINDKKIQNIGEAAAGETGRQRQRE